VSTWAYRVAVNSSLDELRRRKRRPVPSELDGPGATAQSTDETAGVAQRLDIDAALMRLAPEFRAAVVLRDLCGLDYAEIAEVLDIPPGTVRSRIARGRGALADDLTGNPDPDAVRPRPEP
jgi:RNA polymerase sigma-70 factor (ECF subfamily)